MEELQSTEKLDREILDDAKKKALRIRKDCDEAVASQNAEWERKIAVQIKEIDKKYNLLLKNETDSVMARLPVDKLRAKNEKIEELLQSAEDNWFKDLTRQRILELLSLEFIKRISFYGDIEKSSYKNAFFYGVSPEEAAFLLKKADISCKIEEIPPENRYPAIILDTDDVRITASIQKIIDCHLHVRRTELIEALIGRDLMENI
ncbi:MAG: hypothetical protein FWB95_01105 [Treponema sp.]|nr:hypothetical protein [Treponema sp.]